MYKFVQTYLIEMDMRQAGSRHIERWCDPPRRHSGLAYLSPARFEAKNWPEPAGIPGLAKIPAVGEGHLVESGSTPPRAAEALVTPRKEEGDVKLKELQYLPVQ